MHIFAVIPRNDNSFPKSLESVGVHRTKSSGSKSRESHK